VPVEADPFAAGVLPAFFRSLGAEPTLRQKDGRTVVTDGGHWIYDCRFPAGIDDPEALEVQLNNRPGVVENGLFLGMASAAVVAGSDGVRVVTAGGEVAA
jgi:ribose 5-phosphate isomerase A